MIYFFIIAFSAMLIPLFCGIKDYHYVNSSIKKEFKDSVEYLRKMNFFAYHDINEKTINDPRNLVTSFSFNKDDRLDCYSMNTMSKNFVDMTKFIKSHEREFYILFNYCHKYNVYNFNFQGGKTVHVSDDKTLKQIDDMVDEYKISGVYNRLNATEKSFVKNYEPKYDPTNDNKITAKNKSDKDEFSSVVFNKPLAEKAENEVIEVAVETIVKEYLQ